MDRQQLCELIKKLAIDVKRDEYAKINLLWYSNLLPKRIEIFNHRPMAKTYCVDLKEYSAYANGNTATFFSVWVGYDAKSDTMVLFHNSPLTINDVS